jgi:hypothetical protein
MRRSMASEAAGARQRGLFIVDLPARVANTFPGEVYADAIRLTISEE